MSGYLQTVVHETGHNLGMMYDFDDYNKKSRYDSKGKPCKDIAAFMVWRFFMVNFFKT